MFKVLRNKLKLLREVLPSVAIVTEQKFPFCIGQKYNKPPINSRNMSKTNKLPKSLAST